VKRRSATPQRRIGRSTTENSHSNREGAYWSAAELNLPTVSRWGRSKRIRDRPPNSLAFCWGGGGVPPLYSLSEESLRDSIPQRKRIAHQNCEGSIRIPFGHCGSRLVTLDDSSCCHRPRLPEHTHLTGLLSLHRRSLERVRPRVGVSIPFGVHFLDSLRVQADHSLSRHRLRNVRNPQPCRLQGGNGLTLHRNQILQRYGMRVRTDSKCPRKRWFAKSHRALPADRTSRRRTLKPTSILKLSIAAVLAASCPCVSRAGAAEPANNPLPSLLESPCVVHYTFAPDSVVSPSEGTGASISPTRAWTFVTDSQTWRSEFIRERKPDVEGAPTSSWKQSVWTNWHTAVVRPFAIESDTQPDDTVLVGDSRAFFDLHGPQHRFLLPLMTSHVLTHRGGEIPPSLATFFSDPSTKRVVDAEGTTTATRALNEHLIVSAIWDSRGILKSVTHQQPQNGASAFVRYEFTSVDVIDGMQLPRLIEYSAGNDDSVWETRTVIVDRVESGEEALSRTPIFLQEPPVVNEGQIGSSGHQSRAGMALQDY